VSAWASLADDEPIDARAWMERYALEVSGRGACSYDFGLLEEGGCCPHAFAAAVPESTKESILRVAEPRPDLTLLAGRERRKRLKRYREQNKELFRTADALVRARMHTKPNAEQTDLLSRLVSTPDPDTGELLDAETIRDQVLMHLSNGFNGASITGAWLAYLLATRPDVEEKLLAEIDSITGGDPDFDLQYEDLMALTYTTQVIKETLRIFPPMPVTIRRSLASCSRPSTTSLPTSCVARRASRATHSASGWRMLESVKSRPRVSIPIAAPVPARAQGPKVRIRSIAS